MFQRKSTMIAAALCAAAMGIAAPVSSYAAVDVYFDAAPPAPRVEVAPAPRHGYVWVPGYWDLRGHRHVWRSGHWERERRGYVYVDPRWTERDSRWYLERGRWARADNDRDGVPNARDRAPNNPYRN